MLTDDLATVWPEVADRMRSMLRRRGVRHHDIDEIVQETAARVISTRVSYDDADDLFRWAAVVGGRLAIDLRRKGARISGDELPDRADTVDVAMAAEHRVVLGAVRNRVQELSARDQEALLSTFSDTAESTRRESVRVAVARHRARTRLRVLLDGLAGSAIFVWIRRLRLWSGPAETIAYAAVPAAACLLVTVSAWTGVAQSRADDNASATMLAAQIVPASSSATGSTSAAPDRNPGGSGAGVSGAAPSKPVSGLSSPLPNHVFTIDEPAGGQTTAGTRKKEASDHLWCVTTPALSGGLETRCVDSPVTTPTVP